MGREAGRGREPELTLLHVVWLEFLSLTIARVLSTTQG